MIASLPMYDTAATATANDHLWAAIQQNLGVAPTPLDRSTDPHATWLEPDLVLSQTCGLPYRSGLHGKVQLVGTPDYGLDHCAPGYYYSCLIVRADDPRQTLPDFVTSPLARNDVRSQSGWAALLQHLRDAGAPGEWPGDIIETGGHAHSAQAVADGRADIAAVDAVTWRLLSRDAPVTQDLRVLGLTSPTPGLPFITGPQGDMPALYDAIESAISALAPKDRATLMLRGVVQIATAEYLAVPMP